MQEKRRIITQNAGQQKKHHHSAACAHKASDESRWFKTDYGRSIRSLINEGKYLEKLIDFKATDIFKGRTTYVSIMVLSKKKNDKVQYFFMPSEPEDIKTLFENSEDNGDFATCDFLLLPAKTGTESWSYDNYQIEEIKKRLSETCGVLGDYPKLVIKDGIQALWKKMYHLTDCQVDGKYVIGKNGFKETVKAEKDVMKAVIYNREFYPFKKVEPDAYCIFPYEGASNEVISFSKLKEKYPLLAEYLSANKQRITKQVKCYEGDLWHRFTREHNHALYNADKIIIPMTARDTIATFVNDKGLYMDISGCNDIMGITGISVTAAGNLITKLKKAGLIEAVRGYGKGK